VSLKEEIFRLPGATTVWHKLRPFPRESDYDKPFRTAEEANDLIHKGLVSEAPFLTARIGGNECGCLRFYLAKRRRRRRPTPYRASTVAEMQAGPGFFGATNDNLDRFAEEYLGAIQHVDVIGAFFWRGENRVIREFCPSAELIMGPDIEPYYHANPWSRVLSGRRVLVIHPFAESIRKNYEKNRERLFRDAQVLPAFSLQVIRAVQSIAGEPTDFRTWFDALEHMKKEMDATTYDVCIVGAGAYGLPLAAHAKESGRQAVHMGGATQIFFGIQGRRWDNHEIISNLYNNHWVRPTPAEVPQNYQAVENGCYW
jgi:hypothetical protein